MDYGFAPGTKEVYRALRTTFDRRRPNTRLIHRRGRLVTVQQFLRHLSAAGATDTSGANIVVPVDDLLIGAEANPLRQWDIPLVPGQKTNTDFEKLEEAVTDPSGPIRIPDALIAHNPGDPITHSVHLKGCNLGKARPFLEKLKQGLGGHVRVIAPTHFNGIAVAKALGAFEYMAYEFVVRRRDPFPDRQTAVAEFQAAGFPLIDGSAVPNGAWDDRMANWQEPWIPRRIDRWRRGDPHAPLNMTIGRRTTLPVKQQFRVERIPRTPITVPLPYPDVGLVPVTDADRIQDLENHLLADPRRLFDPLHEFPYFVRFGYPDLAACLADFMFQRRGTNLICTFQRFQYTVVMPITDPATGGLIFNFYPNPGVPVPQGYQPGLLETDATYFESV